MAPSEIHVGCTYYDDRRRQRLVLGIGADLHDRPVVIYRLSRNADPSCRVQRMPLTKFSAISVDQAVPYYEYGGVAAAMEKGL